MGTHPSTLLESQHSSLLQPPLRKTGLQIKRSRYESGAQTPQLHQSPSAQVLKVHTWRHHSDCWNSLQYLDVSEGPTSFVYMGSVLEQDTADGFIQHGMAWPTKQNSQHGMH